MSSTELAPSIESPAGLTADEAARRLAADGPNEVAHGRGPSGLRLLLSQFTSPLVLVLIAAAVVSRLLGEGVEAVVILLIVGLNGLLGFTQEYRAERALRALRRYVTRTARARRDGRVVEIPAAELVRGDVVELEVGDLVPADLRLVAADDFATDESTLTGESNPVAKRPGDVAPMGAAAVSGYATAEVVATGRATLLGRTATLLTRKPDETDFQRNVRRFSDFLVALIAALTAFVFLANALLGKGWFDSFLFAVALAVGITPEVLPAIITIALARGALRMARDQVVVKRLMSVEDLGNVDTLCCDKTGTLTLGEFVLRDFVDPEGRRDEGVLLLGALAASSAGGTPGAAVANPTDRATWACEALQAKRAELADYRVLDRNAFDFHRRRSSVVVASSLGRQLLVKGGSESVLSASVNVAQADGVASLTEDLRQKLATRVADYEQEGLRVLAVAERHMDRDAATEADERDLTLRGFLLYLDPPKPDVRDALEQLDHLGVAVKIMSGDSPTVTRSICREVGFPVTDDQVVNGADIASLSDEELRSCVLAHSAFARVAPDQKHRLVSALRHAGHVVGFLGDGVNDAPALRAADVGLAVDSGADIAKEAADVVLLRKSLGVLAGGIVEGRKTFANITKYILNTISGNFGNMATVAASSLFLRFIPLLPSQILLNNFLADLPLLLIATDRVDEKLLRRPRHWNIRGIARFMIAFGPLSSIFDLALIVALLRVWHADPPLFRTAWFVESACSQVLVLFAVRTQLPFYRSRPSPWLLALAALSSLVAATLPVTGVGRHFFTFVPLPVPIVLGVGAILLVYFLSAEAAKRRFFRHFEL